MASNTTRRAGRLRDRLPALTGQSPGGTMQFTGTVNKWATITLGGNPAAVDASGNWSGTANVAAGANAIPLVAKDVNGNTTTHTINITIPGGTSRTLTYDLDGNLQNDGAGKAYTWDAANRLVTITQGSNVTAFVYNGLGQRVQEKLNGAVIKQWVWNGGTQPAEERDGSNNVTKRFYAQGEQIGGTSYFFTTDHLGSIREMIDGSGTIHARYDYDPYGRITKVSGDLDADFGFTGFYRHQASGLNLTLYRAYDANLGRWPSRDPIGERGGINLYGYVANNPVNAIDSLGLEPRVTFTGGHSVSAHSVIELENIIQNAADGSITSIRFDNKYGEHGNPTTQVVVSPNPLTLDEIIELDPKTGRLWVGPEPVPTTPFTAAFFGNKLSPTATIYFTGCRTAVGDKNITQASSEMLKDRYPDVTVIGNQKDTMSFGGLAFPDWINDLFGYRSPRSYRTGKPVGN